MAKKETVSGESVKHAAARLCGLYKRSNSAKIAVYSIRNGQMRRDRIQLRKRRCHKAFSPSREAGISISNRRERRLAPSGRACLPCGGRASPAAFAPPGICGNAPSTRRKRLCPSTCVVFDGIVSFFVCAAFEKRLQIVKQKDGPCGTAFALDAIRSAAWRPFCTSPQSRRACPQSAAPRAARAV